MNGNSYLASRSDSSSVGPVRAWLKAALWRCSVLLASIGFGGIIGALTAVVAGFTFPPSDGLSYGQSLLFITIPLCSLIGAATGFSLGLAFTQMHVLAIASLVVTSGIGWFATQYLWNAQVAEYGHDRSEIVLYYPPTGLCIVAICTAALVLVHRLRVTSNQAAT